MPYAISLNTLKAASLFASTEETRYYLGGVLVEVRQFNITYVATNSHSMFVRREYQTEANFLIHDTLDEVRYFIIPTETCNRLKVRKNALDTATMELDPSAVCGDMTKSYRQLHRLAYNDAIAIFQPIDGVFPDWRRVLPKATESAPTPSVCINWDLMAAFEKASKLLDLGPSILQFGDKGGPIQVQFVRTPDTFGVVMPMSGYKVPSVDRAAIPAFARTYE